MKNTNDNSFPIADQIIAAKNFGLPGMTAQEMRRERDWVLGTVRGARRYYLDDEVTETASDLGQSHPEVLREALRRARTPFERVLLDYSPAAFVRAGGGVASVDAPPRSMVAVEHLDGTRYRLTPIACASGWAFAQCVSVVYDLENRLGPSDDEVFLAKRWAKAAEDDGVRIVSPTEELRQRVQFKPESALKMVRSTLFGGGRYNNTSGGTDTTPVLLMEKPGMSSAMLVDEKEDSEEARTRDAQIEDFKAHGHHALSPSNGWAYRRLLAEEDRKGSNSINRIVAEAINEFSGQWRFIVCALHLINGQDFTSDERWKAGMGQRIVGGKVAPYLEHRRVSLKIPRLEVLRHATRSLGEAIPRRRHEVSGHWRHRRGKGDESCSHVWVNATPNRQQCALCAYDRWWTPDFERGDARLGYVRKDRVVEER